MSPAPQRRVWRAAREGALAASAADVRRLARRAAKLALDALSPPQCPVSGERVAAPGQLSGAGWARLNFIDRPFCVRCGAPFVLDYGPDAVCPPCLAEPPAFDAARAAVVYDAVSAPLLLSYKNADRTELATVFAAWLARAGADFARDGALVTSVPLHRRRLFSRRFNQAALLAQRFASAGGLECDVSLLRRRRATASQQSLSEAGRRRNVRGAFELAPEAAARVFGRPIVVVDDVATTGATLSACARPLKRAGAARVDALVVARVVRGAGDAI
ncbi:MAG: ComF family protein [Parvularculaceae bacterium]